MKFSKTLATSFVAIAALIFASIPAHAAPGDTFIDIRPARGESAASVFENGGPVGMSIRQAVRNAVSSGNFESWICRTGVDEKNCNPDEPKTIYTARQLLPYCAASSQENCIEEVAFAKQDGPFVPAKFIRTTDVNPLPEIADQGLWAASGLSLFKAADDSTDGGQLDFAVAPAVNLRYSNQSKMWESYSLESGLYAYRLSAPTSPRYIQDSTWADGTRHMQTMGDPNCIWSDSSACGIQQDLSNGTRIRLTLRVSNSISGWFRGRITKPDIQLTKFSDKNNRIVIAANPVEVSRMTAILNAQNSTKEQQDAIKATGGNGALGSLFDGENKGPHSTWGDFGWVEMFRDLAKDTAIATTTTWNFSTIETRGNNNCLNDTSRVLGIVSTNATMYNGVVPEFSGGMLNYKVAGMHYLPDGKTPAEGTYDLVMRSDIARCLYGFSSAPIGAAISVVGEGGETRTAVTTVKEESGWLKLAAYGFTFSSPTISVKIIQAAAKKTTITCAKGKLIKKVTGTSPKCPAGYKKK